MVQPENREPQMKRSTRERRMPAKFSDYELLFAEEVEPSALVSEFSEPTYKVALKDVNSEKWQAAMREEMILYSRIELGIWYLFHQIENHSGTSGYIM